MATLIQAQNSMALDRLGLKLKPNTHGGQMIVGGPQTWEVTQDTVKAVQALVGSTFTVESDGKITAS